MRNAFKASIASSLIGQFSWPGHGLSDAPECVILLKHLQQVSQLRKESAGVH